jgi:hypothetical protein
MPSRLPNACPSPGSTTSHARVPLAMSAWKRSVAWITGVAGLRSASPWMISTGRRMRGTPTIAFNRRE